MIGGMRTLLAIVLSLPLAAAAQTYQTQEHSFRVVKLVEGLDHPWSLAFLPDGRMLVTERSVTSMRPSGRKASDQGWSRPSTSFTTRNECSCV